MNTYEALLYLGFIFICGLVILIFVDKNYLYKNENRSIILMVGISIVLNIMILVFCIISYSKMKVKSGDKGMSGIRGQKGNQGDNVGIPICGDMIVKASEKKFNIKNQQLQYPKKPYIIE